MLKLSPTLLQPEFCSWLKRCDAWVLLFKLLEHSMSTWSAIVVSYCTIQYSSFEFICKFKFILCLIGIYYLCMYVWIYLLPNLGFIGSQEIFLGWGWLHISRWSPSPSSVGGVLSLLNVHYCTKCKPGLWKAYSTLSCRFVSSFPHCSQWVFNNQYWVAVWAVTELGKKNIRKVRFLFYCKRKFRVFFVLCWFFNNRFVQWKQWSAVHSVCCGHVWSGPENAEAVATSHCLGSS